MDRGGNIPAVLVANNVVYQNGGNCIHAFHVQHVWNVNNTCYKSGLDSLMADGDGGEFVEGGTDTADIHTVNNIAVAFTTRYQYYLPVGAQETYRKNDGYRGKGVYNTPTPTYTLNPL